MVDIERKKFDIVVLTDIDGVLKWGPPAGRAALKLATGRLPKPHIPEYKNGRISYGTLYKFGSSLLYSIMGTCIKQGVIDDLTALSQTAEETGRSVYLASHTGRGPDAFNLTQKMIQRTGIISRVHLNEGHKAPHHKVLVTNLYASMANEVIVFEDDPEAALLMLGVNQNYQNEKVSVYLKESPATHPLLRKIGRFKEPPHLKIVKNLHAGIEDYKKELRRDYFDYSTWPGAYALP